VRGLSVRYRPVRAYKCGVVLVLGMDVSESMLLACWFCCVVWMTNLYNYIWMDPDGPGWCMAVIGFGIYGIANDDMI